MAHIFGIVRGAKHQLDLWKTFMQTIPYKWTRKENGKEVDKVFYGAYQPIELFSYIVPEDQIEQALTAMRYKGQYTGRGIKGKVSGLSLTPLRLALGAKPLKAKIKKADLDAVRKACKLNGLDEKATDAHIKELTKTWKTFGYKPRDVKVVNPIDSIHLTILGVKKDKKGKMKDKYGEDKDFEVEQEML